MARSPSNKNLAVPIGAAIVITAIIAVSIVAILMRRDTNAAAEAAYAKAAAAVVPTNFQQLNVINFHNSNKKLFVFSQKTCSDQARTDCAQDDQLKLVVLDPAPNTANVIATINPIAQANAGGIFVPFALTKDDVHILMDAWMGSPGAGGGLIDYGYATIPVNPQTKPYRTLEEFHPVATRDAIFYDNYGRVVYLDDSPKTPQYTMPGPQYNRGKIVFRDLGTDVSQTLLEETDTTYDLKNIDEQNHKLNFSATTYAFSVSCPREHDALTCAQTNTTDRSILIP